MNPAAEALIGWCLGGLVFGFFIGGVTWSLGEAFWAFVFCFSIGLLHCAYNSGKEAAEREARRQRDYVPPKFRDYAQVELDRIVQDDLKKFQ